MSALLPRGGGDVAISNLIRTGNQLPPSTGLIGNELLPNFCSLSGVKGPGPYDDTRARTACDDDARSSNVTM